MKRIQAKGSVLGVVGATALSLSLLVWWTRELRPGWLMAAAAAAAMAVALLLTRRDRVQLGGRRGWRAMSAAVVVLLIAVVSATLLTLQFERTQEDWSAVLERRQSVLGEALAERMDDVVQRGRQAADSAAALALQDRPAGNDVVSTAPLFRQLSELRDDLRVDAIAVYTGAGNLVAWAGQHQGALPDSIWMPDAPAAYFEERPLFSYIYFPVPVAERSERAIAAVLVESGVLTESGDIDVSDVVAARTRTRASFRRGSQPDAVWALTMGSDTVVSARLDLTTQQEWRDRLEAMARRVVLLSALAAMLATIVAWLSWAPRGWAALMPLVWLTGMVALAPVGDALPWGRLFEPLLFTLPVPGDVSLGRLLSVLLPVAALAAAARRPALQVRLLLPAVLGGSVVVALAYPLLLGVLLDGATPALLQGGPAYWVALQLAAVMLLGSVTALLMPRAMDGEAAWPTPVHRPAMMVAALLGSAALALYTSTGAHPDEPMRLWLAAAWAIPFGLAATALAPASGRSGAVTRWLVAGWLAGTAVMPHLWVAQTESRLASAEGELETLGTRADPYLEFLLVNFGREAVGRFAAGESGVQLLYRTWVASGLAQETYPADIVLWSGMGFPEVQLGDAPLPTEHEVERLLEIVDVAGTETSPLIRPFADLPNMSRLLTVPLPDGSLITVRVPPRRTLERASTIAPFLGVVAPSDTRLNLVEVTGADPSAESMEWSVTPDGWRSEAVVKYPDGWYHAHLAITLPPFGVQFARGALLLTLALALFLLLWVAGVLLRGGTAVPRGDWTGWLGSFRARITLALFGFFVVPTAVFGWVAYSALSGEVARAAQTVAQHSAAQAAVEFEEGVGDLRDLAAHAGTDVLRYQGGELIDVSSREALDLGVYHAWLPPGIHQRLESGEELSAVETRSLGGHAFVTAYRALRPSGMLAVPMSLSAGDTALRQRQFAHLVLFAAVVGALLSLALSLAVGRTLARPIGMLRRASAAVGAGSLRVRLPERSGDEFGQLFTSFNRMTRRLRRARARELRTARVLAWGEMARQIAHEIKNPLTPIKLSVQHLRRAYADRHPQFDEILESNVTQVLGEIDRLSEIARAFSRYGAPALATGPLVAVNAPAVIGETLLLYRSGDRNVRYEEDVQSDLPDVLARPNELKEVLLNLVENSRTAFDGGGTVTISAVHREERVEITVSDDGPGIPPEMLPRIFDPHFSTRTSGTGLGLAIVRRVVDSWGGSVTAESEVGSGTRVRLRLAVAATEPGS